MTMRGPKALHRQILAWLLGPSERPLALTGASGVGKTYTASMLIQQCKYEQTETIDGARSYGLTGERRIAVLDTPTRSEIESICRTLKHRHPHTIILTEDFTDIPWRWRSLFVHLHIPEPTQAEKVAHGRDLTRRLSLDIDDPTMHRIVESAKSWRAVENRIKTGALTRGRASVRECHTSEPIESNSKTQNRLAYLEWNHADVEQVWTAQQIQSQVWRTDDLGKVATAYLRTIKTNRTDKVPFRKRKVSKSANFSK